MTAPISTAQISPAGERFLTGRGLEMELAVRMGLSSESGASGEALVYPFVRKGQVVGRKFRPLQQREGQGRFWWSKDRLQIAWNEDCLRDDSLIGEPVLITEGQDDALAAIQSGFLRTISVPDGAPEKPVEDAADSKRYEWLTSIAGELLTQTRVPQGFILAVDGDEAGAALLHDLALLLHRVRCKFLVYPKAKDPKARGRDRLKDLNEVLEEWGEKGVRDCIARAQWLKVDGVFAMSDLPPMPKARIYEVGFDAWSEHFKLRLGDFSVFTGTPGSGKSTFLNDVACRVAFRHGVRVAWASFEQPPQIDHKRALRSWFHERPAHTQTPDELRAADAWIDQMHRFVVPRDDEDVHLDWLLQKLEAAVIQQGCKWLIIDPWNELDHDKAPGENETEYTGRAIRTLKRFARAFQVHVTIVAHPTKLRRGDDGRFPTPTLYDISGSAHWANKADLGVVVHRVGDETIVTTAKSRYHDTIGKPGKVSMHYSHETRHFIEVMRDAPDEGMGRIDFRGRE